MNFKRFYPNNSPLSFVLLLVIVGFGFATLNNSPFISLSPEGQLADVIRSIFNTNTVQATSTNFSAIGLVNGISSSSLSLFHVTGSDRSRRASFIFDLSHITKIQTESYIPITLADINIGDKVIVQGLDNSGTIVIRRIILFSNIGTTSLVTATGTNATSTTRGGWWRSGGTAWASSTLSSTTNYWAGSSTTASTTFSGLGSNYHGFFASTTYSSSTWEESSSSRRWWGNGTTTTATSSSTTESPATDTSSTTSVPDTTTSTAPSTSSTPDTSSSSSPSTSPDTSTTPPAPNDSTSAPTPPVTPTTDTSGAGSSTSQ